jgi:hypothetical protein
MKVIHLPQNIQTYIFFFDSSSVGMGSGITGHGYGNRPSAVVIFGTQSCADHELVTKIMNFQIIIPWIRGL